MFGKYDRVLRSALLLGASVGALSPGLALAASAQASTVQIDIPAQSVATALRQLANETGANILFAPDSVGALRTPGVSGRMTADEAARRIVLGTSLQVVGQADGAIVVREAQALPPRSPARSAKPASAPGVETVVVTAQKKSEDIQTVPIAVSAFSQKQLTERQVAGGPDLVKEVPNLTFSKTNFTGYNLEIRGIGTQAISVTTDPAVAVAFNGIPFIRNHFFEQEFYDLDNLEVLRGPQGTLYGRNATAGVVNIISAKPTDTYEAVASADFGNYNNRRFEGMLNIPIVGDKLDLRVAGEWTKRDGYSFNELTGKPIDGRDLWSGRASLRWRPTSDLEVNLVWEHFSESDNRMRTAKQLCKTAPVPTNIDGVNPFNFGGAGNYAAPADYLSQGCLPSSLYSPTAFQVPNGFTLAYYAPLNDAGAPTRLGFDVYASAVQSPNLRVIESALNPVYRAKNDTIELNTDYQLSPVLTLTSQTGFNQDFLWSTEDYDRFNSAPGAFVYHPGGPGTDPNGTIIPDPAAGKNGVPADAGIFCDPQLGCSDRLVLEDLSDEHAWQLSQEVRLASNFSGLFNFSVGGNYLHYETEENYYVFINSLTLLAASLGAPGWNPGVSDNTQCLVGGPIGGLKTPNPTIPHSILGCDYIDPNPIGSLNNQGHNYFLSQNPYDLNSYAVFGEAYYNLTNELKLTGGLRWTDDQKHFVDIPSEIVVPGYGYAVTKVVNQQWDQFTGRAAVNWTPKLDFTDQTLLYGSYAHGYKAGGANPPGAIFPSVTSGVPAAAVIDPVHPLTFKPEFIDAFELGTKNTLLDGTLTINADVFYYNYKDYQISEIVDRTAINQNFNAIVRGAEVESSWEPVPGLKFGLAGGWENATLDKGDSAVDLMDRTAGNPNWMVVKPFVTNASNCILPTYVVAARILAQYPGTPFYLMCGDAYNAHHDPLTQAPYVPNPTMGPGGGPLPAAIAGYPGFDPLSVDPSAPANVNNGLGLPPNNGEGFSKNLAGHKLPNAPPFTLSFTGEYTVPVWSDWAATLHGDFYWQGNSFARVFNDRPYDQLHGYTNVNLSLILNSTDGWQLMGYVKNVFNATAITGDFLNSDDTGLTTNVFLTDPRLFGVRITKNFGEGDTGTLADVDNSIASLFADAGGGRPPLWIELGGGLERILSPQETLDPSFMSSVTIPGQRKALAVQAPPRYGFDEDAKVIYETPADWLLIGSVRYGRSGSDEKHHQQTPNAKIPIVPFTVFGFLHLGGYSVYPTYHVKFADGTPQHRESHAVFDFRAGKDVGLGMFGEQVSSVVSAGLRIAQFQSRSNASLNVVPDLHYPTAPVTSFPEWLAFHFSAPVHFHADAASITDRRSFRGVGPSVAWDASLPYSGEIGTGQVTFDWGANAALLFGRQKTRGHHQTTTHSYYERGFYQPVGVTHGAFAYVSGSKSSQSGSWTRARTTVVPNLGGFAGISYRYNNAKISFGYRTDFFFGAMDGGIDKRRSENLGFSGPFASIRLGLGG